VTPALLPTLRRVVDARAGIATRLWEMPADPLTPNLFVSATTGPAASYFITYEPAGWTNSSVGSGAGFTREQALWATVGETVERYAASIYDKDDFIVCREADLEGSTVDLGAWIGLADGVAPFSAYDPNVFRAWVAGTSLIDGTTVYAPAQLIYLSQEWQGTELIAQTVSTGLACHSSVDRAALSGMLELIERDGFASAWLLRFAPPRLRLTVAEHSALSHECQVALASCELPITLHAVPNEFGIANVFAFAEAPSRGYGVVGACARASVTDAVEKAVIEVLHGWSATAAARQGTEAIPDLADVRKPHDHSLYYLQPATWAAMAWFRQSPLEIGSNMIAIPLPGGVDELAGRLAAAGCAPSLFELTTIDVRALGLHVCRTLAPGLQPLTFGAGVYPKDRRRLEVNARQWGITCPSQLNNEPHPFP
jgi:ribosomal protein S12 methylthiotransferase accessory factor